MRWRADDPASPILCAIANTALAAASTTAISDRARLAGAFSPPPDTKLACLDRDHEEKISHRVDQPQLRERGLTMPLPVRQCGV
jgi:hypothetical protein